MIQRRALKIVWTYNRNLTQFRLLELIYILKITLLNAPVNVYAPDKCKLYDQNKDSG